MSTRATYQINGTTFYIHHDGYPEGAAMYFNEALKWPENAPERAPNASFADDFMRGNLRAEITGSHESHGDTKFRYTVQTEGDFRFGSPRLSITAQARRGYDGDEWVTIYTGTVQDFIEHYRTELVA